MIVNELTDVKHDDKLSRLMSSDIRDGVLKQRARAPIKSVWWSAIGAS